MGFFPYKSREEAARAIRFNIRQNESYLNRAVDADYAEGLRELIGRQRGHLAEMEGRA
jgi:hypothetical protein